MPMRLLANRLRVVAADAVPGTTEAVKVGWRLIGLYVPTRRKPAYYGFILPHADSVTLGLSRGIGLHDPDGVLLGAAEKLKDVRYLSYRGEADIDVARASRFLREAADLALTPVGLRAAFR
jgi:hypothetical protein